MGRLPRRRRRRPWRGPEGRAGAPAAAGGPGGWPGCGGRGPRDRRRRGLMGFLLHASSVGSVVGAQARSAHPVRRSGTQLPASASRQMLRDHLGCVGPTRRDPRRPHLSSAATSRWPAGAGTVVAIIRRPFLEARNGLAPSRLASSESPDELRVRGHSRHGRSQREPREEEIDCRTRPPLGTESMDPPHKG